MDTSWTTDPTYVTTGALATIAVILAAVAASDRAVTRLARRLLRLVAHLPDAQLVAATVRWWRRRLIGISCGLLLGTAASTAFVWGVGANRSHPVVDMIVVGGIAGGIFGAAARRAPVSSEGPLGQNVAHSRMLRLADFTPAWLRHAARSAVAIAVLITCATIVALLVSPRGYVLPMVPAPSLILTVLGVAALIRFEIIGRRIVQRCTSAHSEGDLANDSILRCLAVRDLAQAAALVGIISSLLALPGLAVALDLSLPAPELLQGFNLAAAVVAGVCASIAIFGPTRIRPPIEHPRRPVRAAELSS